MNESKENDNRLKKAKSRVLVAFFASVTLGLAPFVPEPHLFGKWRWLIGGAEGMQAMDWFDLVLHTSPWVYLVFSVIRLARLRRTTS